MNATDFSLSLIKASLITFCLAIINPAFAEKYEYEWVATNKTDTFTGTEKSFSAAVSSMQTACYACKFLTKRTTNNGYSFSFKPSKNFENGEFDSWSYSTSANVFTGPYAFASESGVLGQIEDWFAESSPEECARPSAAGKGAWTDAPSGSPPLEEVTNQSKSVEVTTYYGEQCESRITGSSINRSRMFACHPELTKGTETVNDENGGIASRRLACAIGATGAITASLVQEPCDDKVGNPCSVSTGNKTDSVTDHQIGLVRMTRSYNSRQTLNTNTIGFAWRHSYADEIVFQTPNTPKLLIWSTGRPVLIGGANINYRPLKTFGTPLAIQNISKVGNEWHVTRSNGDQRIYREDGKLIRIQFKSNKFISLTYGDQDRLQTVTDYMGNEMTFEYTEQLITSVLFSDGYQVSYEYDSQQNLTAVVYPDLTPNDDSDNPRLTYHYEQSNLPHFLTGITDENSSRYATYSYDEQGRAISTEHAQTTNSNGQEKFLLDYQEGN